MSSTSIATRSVRTPVKQTATAPVTESPGNWKHPRLAEITRRQNAKQFSGRDISTILWNIVFLAGLFVAQFMATYLPSLPQVITRPVGGYISITALAWGVLKTIPLLKIGLALLPLLKKKDELADIPLTPAQRKLLGLPPSSRPATPNATYSTPPKYQRTPSYSSSAASNRSHSGSPLSAKGSPSQAISGKIGGSPYAQNGSPLLQKAINGGFGGRRSSLGSLGSPSPRGGAMGSNLFLDGPTTTPSPTSAKRSTVGLNNKWLYEKGRRSSGGWGVQ